MRQKHEYTFNNSIEFDIWLRNKLIPYLSSKGVKNIVLNTADLPKSYLKDNWKYGHSTCYFLDVPETNEEYYIFIKNRPTRGVICKS